MEKLQAKVDLAMASVAEKVKKEMILYAISDVYAAYEPKEYKRRESMGGLIADENIKITHLANGVAIQNIALPHPDYGLGEERAAIDMSLAWLIENGLEYDFIDMPPRPFVSHLYKDLKAGLYRNLLKVELQKLGLKAR